MDSIYGEGTHCSPRRRRQCQQLVALQHFADGAPHLEHTRTRWEKQYIGKGICLIQLLLLRLFFMSSPCLIFVGVAEQGIDAHGDIGPNRNQIALCSWWASDLWSIMQCARRNTYAFPCILLDCIRKWTLLDAATPWPHTPNTQVRWGSGALA